MSRQNVLIERPLTLALAPVLLAQAAWTIARAPRLPEPIGPRHGLIGRGRPLKLLVVGDSSAAGVGVPTQDDALTGQLTLALAAHFEVEWRLIARSGATTAQTREMLADADLDKVDIAITALGVNDVKNGIRLDSWLDDTIGLHTDLRQRAATKRIIVSGLPPLKDFPALPRPLGSVLHARAERFEGALKERLHLDQSNAEHLPFDLPIAPDLMAIDGFHPGPVIYREWAARVASRIQIERA